MNERREERRKKLIEAGISTVGVQGYSKTKVKDICQAAKLTERYFYESFTDRESFLFAVYDESANRMTAVLDAAAEDVSNAPESVVRAYFTFIRENPPMARILFFEGLGVSEALDARYREGVAGLAGFFQRVFRYEVEQPMHGLAAAGAVIALGSAWVLMSYAEGLESLVKQTLAFIANEAVAHP